MGLIFVRQPDGSWLGKQATKDKPDKEAGDETKKRRADLSKLTVPQLRELAEEKSIPLGSSTRKDNIISLIIKYEANAGAE